MQERIPRRYWPHSYQPPLASLGHKCWVLDIHIVPFLKAVDMDVTNRRGGGYHSPDESPFKRELDDELASNEKHSDNEHTQRTLNQVRVMNVLK